MYKTLPFFFLYFSLAIFCYAQPTPTHAQLAWQQAELGFVFHYDLHVFDSSLYKQTVNRIIPIADYNIFNPEKLDVEQWVLAAKAAGARFALITATHETGFALYQSDVNPYCLKAVKWKDGKGDIVKDFVGVCRKHNIKPGIYIGIRWNSFFGVHNFVADGSGEMQKQRQLYYNKMAEGMVKELCTRYGELFEIWFDGGASSPEKGAPDVLPIVKKYQPNALFYHNNQLAEARWGGSESGTVGYPCWAAFPYPSTGSGEDTKKEIAANKYALLKHGDSLGKYYMPAMADAPLHGYNGRHEWFWEPGDEKHIYPLSDLMDMYYKSVGRNATLIIGLTPDNTGLLPQADVQRLKEWGIEINRRFERPITSAKCMGKKLELRLPKVQTVNQIVLQENIANGQRIKNFIIQAFVQKRWQTIVTGSSVGHKFIYLLPQCINTNRLRLIVNNSFEMPEIINFSVYFNP